MYYKGISGRFLLPHNRKVWRKGVQMSQWWLQSSVCLNPGCISHFILFSCDFETVEKFQQTSQGWNRCFSGKEEPRHFRLTVGNGNLNFSEQTHSALIWIAASILKAKNFWFCSSRKLFFQLLIAMFQCCLKVDKTFTMLYNIYLWVIWQILF